MYFTLFCTPPNHEQRRFNQRMKPHSTIASSRKSYFHNFYFLLIFMAPWGKKVIYLKCSQGGNLWKCNYSSIYFFMVDRNCKYELINLLIITVMNTKISRQLYRFLNLKSKSFILCTKNNLKYGLQVYFKLLQVQHSGEIRQ